MFISHSLHADAPVQTEKEILRFHRDWLATIQMKERERVKRLLSIMFPSLQSVFRELDNAEKQ